jgi:hypothetical protein
MKAPNFEILSTLLSDLTCSETHDCSSAGSSKVAWVEYKLHSFPLCSHRTTYFLEELVSTDGKLQTEVHERTVGTSKQT